MAVVPATSAHAAALALMHGAAFPPGERWDADALAQQLALPGAYGLAALRGDGAPAGFILARVAADEAEVLTLAVVPALQGQGIGGLLLRAALGRAAAAGAAAMFLEVSPKNAVAVALYARAGFMEVGRRTGYYPGGGAAVVLRRGLSPGEAKADGFRPPRA